jgi:hydrogenase maturation protease
MIAVIGCGNANRCDDGVASEILRVLAAGRLGREPRVRLLDTGTDGMSVMFSARGSRALIILDACRSGSIPGAIFEVPGSELARRHAPSFTLHDFRWEHALDAGRRLFGESFPSDVVVILIEAESTALGIGLSPSVAAAAGAAVARVESLVDARLPCLETAR